MSTTNADIGSRIASLRTARALTQADLASALGLEHKQVVSNLEKGERALKASELARLSEIFHVSPLALLGLQALEATPFVLWRQPTEERARREDEATFLERCRRFALLERLSGLQPAALPRHYECDPKRTSFENVALSRRAGSSAAESAASCAGRSASGGSGGCPRARSLSSCMRTGWRSRSAPSNGCSPSSRSGRGSSEVSCRHWSSTRSSPPTPICPRSISRASDSSRYDAGAAASRSTYRRSRSGGASTSRTRRGSSPTPRCTSPPCGCAVTKDPSAR